jgi:uncharacterized membrane protein
MNSKRKDEDCRIADEAENHQWFDFRGWSIWMQILAMILTLYVAIGASIKLISMKNNRVG